MSQFKIAVDPSDYQEDLFNRLISMKPKIDDLAAYIQNDLREQLIDDPIDYDNSIKAMSVDYTNFITVLNDIRNDATRLMKHFGDKDASI